MEILFWQLGILFFIVISAVLFGKKGLIYSSIAASIGTGVMVLTSWLMILQYVTVFVGLVMGGVILGSENHKNIQSGAWSLIMMTILFGVIGIWWLIDYNKSTSANSNAYSSLVPMATEQRPISSGNEVIAPLVVQGTQLVHVASKPAQGKYSHSQRHSDLRHCLNLPSDEAIIRCANLAR